MTQGTDKYSPPEGAEPLTFRAYFSIRFDKPVDSEEFFEDMSTGCFYIKSGGRTYTVDFTETYAGIDDEEGPDVVEFCLKNPSIDESDPELLRDIYELTFDALSKADSIDFNLEYDADNFSVVEVVSGSFDDPYSSSTSGNYPFSEEAIRSFGENLRNWYG